MKIEIDIPQLTELNRKIEQLIDTLNDVAVMQVNALRKPVILDETPEAPAEVFEAANRLASDPNYKTVGVDLSPKAEIESMAAEPAPKRTRKKREVAPEPEIITYGEAEVQAANDFVQAAAAIVTEQEQPALVAAEETAPVPAQEETSVAPVLDMDYFRANVIPAIASANKLPEAKAWIAEHGADALKDLDPEHYAAFHKFACELCGVENL